MMQLSNTLAQAVQCGTALLADGGVPDALFDARCLAESCFGFTRTQLLTCGNMRVPAEAMQNYHSYLVRRIAGEPLQYLLGEWEFMGIRFFLGTGVLIPRPETELLAVFARAWLSGRRGAIVWDLCAGSGCIGISVAAACPEVQVYLVEKSEQAMAYLKKNLSFHSLPNCMAVQADISSPGALDALPAPSLLLSNPPYVPTGELPHLQREVQMEPCLALDGGTDGLDFYPILADLLPRLTSDGAAAVECGDGQAAAIRKLFGTQGFTTECLTDGNGIMRTVTAFRTTSGVHKKNSHFYG